MRRRTGLRGRVGTVTALGLLKCWGHPLTCFYIFILTTGDTTAFLCIFQPFRENTADKMPTTLLLPRPTPRRHSRGRGSSHRTPPGPTGRTPARCSSSGHGDQRPSCPARSILPEGRPAGRKGKRERGEGGGRVETQKRKMLTSEGGFTHPPAGPRASHRVPSCARARPETPGPFGPVLCLPKAGSESLSM